MQSTTSVEMDKFDCPFCKKQRKKSTTVFFDCKFKHGWCKACYDYFKLKQPEQAEKIIKAAKCIECFENAYSAARLKRKKESEGEKSEAGSDSGCETAASHCTESNISLSISIDKHRSKIQKVNVGRGKDDDKRDKGKDKRNAESVVLSHLDVKLDARRNTKSVEDEVKNTIAELVNLVSKTEEEGNDVQQNLNKATMPQPEATIEEEVEKTLSHLISMITLPSELGIVHNNETKPVKQSVKFVPSTRKQEPTVKEPKPRRVRKKIVPPKPVFPEYIVGHSELSRNLSVMEKETIMVRYFSHCFANAKCMVELFGKFGKIKKIHFLEIDNVNISSFRCTRPAKFRTYIGYAAFITFSHWRQAQRALKHMPEKELMFSPSMDQSFVEPSPPSCTIVTLTKIGRYCKSFCSGTQCVNPECFDLHAIPEDLRFVFTPYEVKQNLPATISSYLADLADYEMKYETNKEFQKFYDQQTVDCLGIEVEYQVFKGKKR